MSSVLLTAFGVGGATVVGATLGFIFRKFSGDAKDIMTSFAAGVMLAASIIGLIIPAADGVDALGFPMIIIGLFLGAVAVNRLDGMIPRLRRFVGIELLPGEDVGGVDGVDAVDAVDTSLDRVLLFVTAIAIHNFPEGIAAGVGFGCGEFGESVTIIGGIILQNIPEGMIIVSPMLSAGISRFRTFICAFSSGIVEVVGTLIGYYAVSFSSAILPLALAFAGGAMIYVISDEMIPDAHGGNRGGMSAYSLLLGFAVMLAVDFYI